ncbi:hypothetical protein PAPYR_9973 [Paratrimastix pyriformis]|uniref:Uncharacterized protein n=1 Tax=Paratrimastix pyriformis TaxID=342808 RepID=A0ABQ8U6Z8_9EUKA|nr:hypothetical protein PAPYR_9973 [Paratrimastix pyriformis]
MMRFALRDDAVRLARSCGSPCAIMRCAAPGTLVYLELYALCGALQSVTCAVTRDAASRDGFFQSVFAGVRCSWLQCLAECVAAAWPGFGFVGCPWLNMDVFFRARPAWPLADGV